MIPKKNFARAKHIQVQVQKSQEIGEEIWVQGMGEDTKDGREGKEH